MELKFRAWDQERKVMVDGNEIEEAEQPYEEEGCYIAQITRYQTGLSYGKLFVAYISERGDFTECEVMQSTGLRDKNGREIYESDVVRNWQGGWNVVVYKAPAFEATVSADQSSSYSREWWATVEIIGNIHANPDLLK